MPRKSSNPEKASTPKKKAPARQNATARIAEQRGTRGKTPVPRGNKTPSQSRFPGETPRAQARRKSVGTIAPGKGDRVGERKGA